MITHVIMFKNVLLNCYTTPQFIDLDPDTAATQLQRSIVLGVKNDDSKINQFATLEMYHVGDFDDITGKITPIEPKFLFSPRELIIQLHDAIQKENEKAAEAVPEV